MYLFVLSPPYQGSTVLYRLLDTSPNISTLLSEKNPSHVGEGCALFHLTKEFKIKDYLENRFNPNFEISMSLVKKAYESIWDTKKKVLCDKSPPTIVRAKKYEQYFSQFSDVSFICLIRDPYACRYDITKWSTYAQYIKYNLENLEHCLLIRYEELTDSIDSTIKKILNFIPDLKYLNDTIHPHPGIKNTNDCVRGDRNLQLKNCNTPINVALKNKQIEGDPDIGKLMQYFGYRRME